MLCDNRCCFDCLVSCHPCGRARLCSWVTAGCCGYLGVKQLSEDTSLTLSTLSMDGLKDLFKNACFIDKRCFLLIGGKSIEWKYNAWVSVICWRSFYNCIFHWTCGSILTFGRNINPFLWTCFFFKSPISTLLLAHFVMSNIINVSQNMLLWQILKPQ